MAASLSSIFVAAIAAVIAIFCLAIAAWQARPNSPPQNRAQRMGRSIIVGFLANGVVFSIATIVGVLDQDFQWTGNTFVGIACIAVPLQLLATVGTYIQFGYLPWMQRQVNTAAKDRPRMRDDANSHN
jgi:threonine/homoserine/homoserine lactone efflux protein